MHEVYIRINTELTTRTAWKRSWHRHSLSYSQWYKCATCPPLALLGLLLLAAPVVLTRLHQEPLRQGVREERESASNTHGPPSPDINQAEGDSNDAIHIWCCVIPTAPSRATCGLVLHVPITNITMHVCYSVYYTNDAYTVLCSMTT